MNAAVTLAADHMYLLTRPVSWVDIALAVTPLGVFSLIGRRRCNTAIGANLYEFLGWTISWVIAVTLGGKLDLVVPLWTIGSVYLIVSGLWRDARRWHAERAEHRAGGSPGGVQAPSLWGRDGYR